VQGSAVRRTALLAVLAAAAFAGTAWLNVPRHPTTAFSVVAVLLARMAWLPFAALAVGHALRAQRHAAYQAGKAEATQGHARRDRAEFEVRAERQANLRTAKVRSILEAAERLEIYLQPVVRLSDDAVVGFEALSRFRIDPYRSPDMWFAEAHELDMGTELELCALRAAVDQLRLLPARAYMSLNVSPATVELHDLVEVLSGVPAERIVIELTEHAVVNDYERLNGRLANLRAAGVGLAVDDAGAGFASLRHVLRLTPTVIKLDRTLTAGIDGNRGQVALAASLVRFAEDTGATVVAEGVERQAEIECLREVGVEHGQGYLLAAPASFGELARQGLLFRSSASRSNLSPGSLL
jgi:EAL domain-containing protein (putative c-di-GMP-specific phosphodiesterase class I)